jgi:hypothetical protein
MADPLSDKSASSEPSSPTTPSWDIPLIPAVGPEATAASSVANAAPPIAAAPVATAASTFPKDSRVKPLKLLLLLTIFAITGVGSLMLLASSMRPSDADSPTGAGQTPSTGSTRGHVKAANAVAPASGALAPVESRDSARKSKWIASVNSRKAGYGANVVFELQAEDDVEVWRKHVRPVLTMRCAARATEVFVATMSPAMPEGKSNMHTIKVSFDGGEPVEQMWEHSVDHDALFSRNGAPLMRQIAQARSMTFSWAPFNAPPATATFDVDGFAAHQKTAASKCRP